MRGGSRLAAELGTAPAERVAPLAASVAAIMPAGRAMPRFSWLTDAEVLPGLGPDDRALCRPGNAAPPPARFVRELLEVRHRTTAAVLLGKPVDLLGRASGPRQARARGGPAFRLPEQRRPVARRRSADAKSASVLDWTAIRREIWYSQLASDPLTQSERALRARSRKVAWNASSASCGSWSTLRQTPSTIGPCRARSHHLESGLIAIAREPLQQLGVL